MPAAPTRRPRRRVTFAGTGEQPRREWFLAGTSFARADVAPAEARRPRIAAPVSGSVYALDPDIPRDRQRLAVAVTGAAAAHRLRLDARDLGAADSSPVMFPPPGRHQLALVDLAGRTVDRVIFTVR